MREYRFQMGSFIDYFVAYDVRCIVQVRKGTERSG